MSPTPNVLALLIALKQRWALALVLGLFVAAAATAAAWYLLPPSKYLAQARVHLDSNPIVVPGQRSNTNFDFLAFQKTQMAVVKSQMVLNAALKDQKIFQLGIVQNHFPDHLAWLSKEIGADFSAGPEILSISLSGENEAELKILVDAVMKAYLNEFVERDENLRTKNLKHFRTLRDNQEQVLKKKLEVMEKFAPKLGGDPKNPNGPREAKRSLLEQARIRLVTVETGELQKVNVNLAAQEEERKKIETGPLPKTIVNQYVNNDSVIKNHETAIAKLVQKIEDDKPNIDPSKLKEVHKKTFAQIQTLQEAIEARKKDLLEKKQDELKEQLLAEVDKNLEELKYQKLLLTKEEEMLKEVIKGLAEENAVEGVDHLGMAQAQKDFDREAKILDELNASIRSLEFSAPAQSQAQTIDTAVAVKVNDPKQRMLVAGGAGGAGFVLMLVLIALWEFYARRVKSVDEVAYGLNVRLVGTLPAMPASSRGRKIAPNSAAHQRWQTLFTESVDSYRTMLLHEARAHSVQVVMVASAVSGEGKTSLACHLAISMASAGFNTLLVDGDLRNPSAHRVFGLSPNPGLSELLRGEVDLAAAVRPTPAGGAWVMTAGQADLRSIQSLSHDGLRSVFKEIREQFDFVIVDSSPVLPVADSLLLARHVDGVIFSVLCDVSRLPKMAAAQHRLAMLGVPTLGAVVIGSSQESYSPKYHWPIPA